MQDQKEKTISGTEIETLLHTQIKAFFIKRRKLPPDITEKEKNLLTIAFDSITFTETYQGGNKKLGVLIFINQYLVANELFKNPDKSIKTKVIFENCIFESLTAEGCEFEEVVFKNCSIEGLYIGNTKVSEIRAFDTVIKSVKFVSSDKSGHPCSLHVFDGKIKSILFKTHNKEQHTFKAKISFIKTTLGSLTDDENITPSINFSDGTFEKIVEFNKVTFLTPPHFFNSKFNSDLQFKNCEFINAQTLAAEHAYATLKHLMLLKNSDYSALKFHAHELQARHAAGLVYPEKFYSWLYKTFNEYGENLARPWAFFALLAIAFSNLYLWSFIENPKVIACNDNNEWIHSTCDARMPFLHVATIPSILLAIKYTLGPFGLFFGSDVYIIKSLGVKFLNFINFVLGSILWFMIVMQIRTRFKIS